MQEIVASALPWRDASYYSPSEAIAAAKTRGTIAQPHQGRTIDRALYHDAAVSLFLDNGGIIDILCNEDGTVNCILHMEPRPDFQNTGTAEDTILIKLPDQVYAWDRKYTLPRMEGRRLRAIVTTPTTFSFMSKISNRSCSAPF